MKTRDFLLDLLYPPVCLGCGELQPIGTEVPLCPACHLKWEELRRSRCPSCKELRTLCECRPPLLTDLIRNVESVYLVPYQQTDVAGRLLLTAKDERFPILTRFFAEQLEMVLAARNIPSDPSKTYITYLPRSRSRKASAGVDPAQALAYALGKRMGLPVLKAFSRREAPAQKELSGEERLRSARRTYRLRKRLVSLTGATVLMIDDIVTSGATMLAGAELLRSVGVGKIYCISVGKSELSDQERKK